MHFQKVRFNNSSESIFSFVDHGHSMFPIDSDDSHYQTESQPKKAALWTHIRTTKAIFVALLQSSEFSTLVRKRFMIDSIIL